jgi:hypothetical protein
VDILNLASALAGWTKSPVGRAVVETVKFGVPKIVEALQQQAAVTPAEVATATKGFADPADVPIEPVIDVPAVGPAPISPEPEPVPPAPAMPFTTAWTPTALQLPHTFEGT